MHMKPNVVVAHNAFLPSCRTIHKSSLKVIYSESFRLLWISYRISIVCMDVQMCTGIVHYYRYVYIMLFAKLYLWVVTCPAFWVSEQSGNMPRYAPAAKHCFGYTSVHKAGTARLTWACLAECWRCIEWHLHQSTAVPCQHFAMKQPLIHLPPCELFQILENDSRRPQVVCDIKTKYDI